MCIRDVADFAKAMRESNQTTKPFSKPVVLYWVKWKSFIFSDQGFPEVQDMLRYSGDMPRKVHYTPPKDNIPYGIFHMELISRNSKYILESKMFRRWETFSVQVRCIDVINQPEEHKYYMYDPIFTRKLFEDLRAKNEMGMYADW
jgi:hypothetical protein